MLTSATMLAACYEDVQFPTSDVADQRVATRTAAGSAALGAKPTRGLRGVPSPGKGRPDEPGRGRPGRGEPEPTQPPADGEPPVEEPPAEEPPADEPPANEPPAEDPPAEEPPVDDQPPADDPEEPSQPSFAPKSDADAARFLVQASFGGSPEDIAELRAGSYADWIETQMALPPRMTTARVMRIDPLYSNQYVDLFWEYAIENDDQLRQRVAFALSQIVVMSAADTQVQRWKGLFATYFDALQRESFGNYEDLIRELSLSPAMGMYLSSIANEKANPETGSQPDENYARELMQLFTIGLEELTPGGEPTGRPTYTIDDVRGLARVFTGLSWAETKWNWPHVGPSNVVLPMQGYPDHHEPGPKTFLGHTVPAGTDAVASVNAALDHILAHPNVPPFVSKQLIQRLVTSNPSPAYVERVGAAYASGRFESDGQAFGTGRRGDLAATVAAILLDPEARDPEIAADPTFGKVREPALRFAQWARTFRDGKGARRDGAAYNTAWLREAQDVSKLSQRAWMPDTVFGFTQPGYRAPGSWTGDAGLVAPGLSVASGSSITGYAAFMLQHIDGEGLGDAFFDPDYSAVARLAHDPETLVDRLDSLLTYGGLTDTTRDRIVRAVASVPDDGTDAVRTKRVQIAVGMMTLSPEYIVQR